MEISDTPYAAAQPTPAASMPMKVASTLPPIARAQPAGNQKQSHPLGESDKLNRSHIYHNGLNSTNPNHVVKVTSVNAIEPFGNNETETMRFAFLQRCRVMAVCLMIYYAATFLFLQPFFLGTLGLITSIMGFYGSRAPVDAIRFKWLRYYMWANYVMMFFNLWLLIVTLLFSWSIFDFADSHHNDTNSEEPTYYFSSTGLYIGLLVAANTLMHLRCLRTVQLSIAELANAGIYHQAPVAVLATANPTSAV